MSDGSKPRDIKDRTFAFALDIVRFCEELGSSNFVNRRLCLQLLDSGTSIGANVEEARETIYWLRLLGSRDCAGKTRTALCQEAEEIARIIASIIVNTRKKAKRK